MTCFDLPEETRLWRYMPLYYFASLLRNKMWFSRPCRWPDRWDSRLPVSCGYNFSPDDIEVLKESLRRRDLRARCGHFVNCWHIADTETPKMWEEYGKQPGSVAIQTTLEDLHNCVSIHKGGQVQYYDPAELMKPQPLFSHSDLLYKINRLAWESEYRIWLQDDEVLAKINRNQPFFIPALSRGKLVHVSDLGQLIHAIVLAPGASQRDRQILEELCTSQRRNWMHELIRFSNLDPAPLLVA